MTVISNIDISVADFSSFEIRTGFESTNSEDNLIPIKTSLYGNYPNPFNPETTIEYSLKESGNICLEIYNIRGQKVNTLFNEFRKAGYHSVIWSGKDINDNPVSSGIYFYKLNVNDKTESIKKCLLLK
ncbi:MAG: T9SS type A sorting domain-containing protein [Armatimonadetes bacterium]|nr:T9SS type A sorting domain-containing protein [Armatimonadota bacterium]